ncbi:hypothetical protein BD769DRAFT_1432466 [Suillus cothurnatus]|nr:hypothetical protein BD769DRAFT_1432466 [Suillus cothurnatus]
MVMATVKVARVSLGSQLKRSCLLSPQRSFSALKSATRTAPPSTSKASTTSGQVSATTSSNVSKKSATKNDKKSKKAPPAPDSTEANLKQIEGMMNMANTSNLFPTMDMWGTKLVTLDVEVPRDTSLRMLFTNPGAFWHAKQHNFSNWLKNTFSMYTIAKARAFTGVDCDFRFSHLFLPRTWRQLGNVTSYSSTSWLAPMRRTAMDNLPRHRPKDEVNKIVRTRKPSQTKPYSKRKAVIFRAPAISPGATIVSIRSGEVYIAKEPPKRGNRLVIHALVKFETTQEFEVFTKQGQPLEAKSAKPHNVVEYLVLEKVGWYDNTWQVRDQIYK